MRAALLFAVLLVSGCQLKVSYLGSGEVQLSGDYELVDCDLGDLCAEVGFNSKVTLTAVPAAGYDFVGWSGSCRGTDTCSVSLNKDREVRAHFAPHPATPKVIEFNPGNSYFFASPWPNDLRLNKQGALDVHAFPFERSGLWSDQLEKLARDVKGFATNAAISFQVSWQLPDIDNQATDHALLFPLDAASFQPVEVTLFTLNTDQSERNGLISFLPSRPLQPNTRYGLVVTEDIAADLSVADGITKSNLIKAFDNNDIANLNSLESGYRQQYSEIQQKLSNYGQATDNIVAFTTFTTQNTQRYVELIQNTISDWDQAFVVQSIEVTNEDTCHVSGAGPVIAHRLYMEVEFPNYLVGAAPFTNGGGDFVIANGKLEQQGTQPVNVTIEIPCQVPEGVESLGVVVEGAGTGERLWGDWHSQGVVEVAVDAPYSDGPREAELTGLFATLVELVGVDRYSVNLLLAHFNPFNMKSNLGLHYQYGIDLVFARQLANYLAEFAEQDWPVPVSNEKTIYAGTSFGSMAAMHAARVDETTDALDLKAMSRVSQSSVNHIIENISGLPQEAVDFISLYVGADLPVSNVDPTLQLLQTVLEPIDVANHVMYLDELPMLVTMDDYDDAYHGGPSSYQLLGILDESVPFNLEYGGSSEVLPGSVDDHIQIALGREYIVNDNYRLPIDGETPLRLVEEYYYYDGLCFYYAVFNREFWAADDLHNFPCFETD